MVGFYQGYTFEVKLRKHLVDEAWFAEVAITRPDKSRVGVFQSPAAVRDPKAATGNAQTFARLKVNRDITNRKSVSP